MAGHTRQLPTHPAGDNDSGSGEYTLSHPSEQLAPTIVYDANDHATVIDDGITRIAETLSPQGRVIERRVIDSVTAEVLEHVSVGYAGPGDNRAYEIVHTDGADPIVTYIGGPDGLLIIDTDGTATWPLDDGHGHTLGLTHDDGSYTPNPTADEFGVLPRGPQGRGEDSLGWLGGEMRHRTGDHFGLVRMGVRLYHPDLGRFLSVDPIDGGSANTYDYCNADPINCRDLTGEWSLWGIAKTVGGAVACTVTIAVCLGVGLAIAVVDTAIALRQEGEWNERVTRTAVVGLVTAAIGPAVTFRAPNAVRGVGYLDDLGNSVFRAGTSTTIRWAYSSTARGVIARTGYAAVNAATGSLAGRGVGVAYDSARARAWALWSRYR